MHGSQQDGRAGRRAALIRAAEQRGLLGSMDCQLEGRFSDALIDEAKRASGITETGDLLTYALIKVALEDNFGDLLLARKGREGLRGEHSSRADVA